MLNNKSAYTRKMQEAGVCDARGAAFAATAVTLPRGEYGMCMLGVNGSVLSIYDTDMTARVGELLYSIPLKAAEELKVSESRFAETVKGYSLRFTYDGFTYTFKNCYQHKQALDVIRSEAR